MTNMPPPIDRQRIETLEYSPPSHGYDEMDVLSIEVRALQEARAQKTFKDISFLSPEIKQGPLSLDGFAAVNSFMEEHGQSALMHTSSEWTFIPATRERTIVLYDSTNQELVLDGLLETEASQPFTGDMIIDFAGCAVLFDSSTGIGLTLHSSDTVQLYGRDTARLLDAEMPSERLKELIVTKEKRNKANNFLFVTRREGQKPPEGILAKETDVVDIAFAESNESAA